MDGVESIQFLLYALQDEVCLHCLQLVHDHPIPFICMCLVFTLCTMRWYWRSHRGDTGARAPLGAYSVTQSSAQNAPKHAILTP